MMTIHQRHPAQSSMQPGRRPLHAGTRRRRATVMTQGLIFGSLVGMGVMALAVDTGLMFNAKQELRNAADAAALAAASQLGSTQDPTALAQAEAAAFASANEVAGTPTTINTQTDVIFGHAVLNGTKYNFQPNQTPYDAVQVIVRRDPTAADGPVSLLFGKAVGVDTANLQATATAMLVPRDIAVVIDLSGSMNDDSELRHYKQFPSEQDGYRDGVQINVKDVWAALPIASGHNGIGNGPDPSAPGALNGGNSQPGTGSGSPQSSGGNPDNVPEPPGGSSNPAGPRWGWMTGWGQDIVLGQYNPTSDPGFYYIRQRSTTSDSDVIENLTESGYSSAERAALLSRLYDSSSTRYRNRVKVMLGLAGWRSGKSGGKYTGGGNGDNRVDSNELVDETPYPFSVGSWSDYINYVRSSWSQMRRTDHHLQYRYGLKTFVNYLMERRARNAYTPELADCPEEPLNSVKNAVQSMIDVIVSLQTQDRVSLETFAQYGYHAHDLTEAVAGSAMAAALQVIPDDLNGHQAGHFTSVTNIGAGVHEGYLELTSARARTSAAKVVITLTDGKPNVNQSNQYVGNNASSAVNWALDAADEAKEAGMTVYTIGVGADVNEGLLRLVATHQTDAAGNPIYDEDGVVQTDNYFFADNSPDPNNNGLPGYVQQLENIFQTLGGRRPVRLIQ